MEILFDTLGYAFLLLSVGFIFYVFYRVLKYAFLTVKNNDD